MELGTDIDKQTVRGDRDDIHIVNPEQGSGKQKHLISALSGGSYDFVTFNENLLGIPSHQYPEDAGTVHIAAAQVHCVVHAGLSVTIPDYMP